jgi:molybdopterin adenylyltransferase
MEMRLGIITISDKGSRGEREDLSGAVIKELMEGAGAVMGQYNIIPDEVPVIAAKLAEWADSANFDVIVTTGGTGLAARDVTPDATRTILDREIPGFGEMMRQETLKYTPMAILSRATAGTRAKTLIVNLPGSPKAVRECLTAVLPVIPHAVEIITGAVTEHAIPTGRQGHDHAN